MDDPHWPRASSWLLNKAGMKAARHLAILGAPMHLGSISPGRCDLAPGAIRGALRKFSTFDLDSGADVESLDVADLGDLDVAGLMPSEGLEPIRAAVEAALRTASALVMLGGDNSITRPGVRGLNANLNRTGLLTIDAHLDLRDLGAGLTNGNPVRQLLADGLPGGNVIQIGIQSFANSRSYFEVARDAGIRVISAEQTRSKGLQFAVAEALNDFAARTEAIYVDLDLDVMDRMFAPATPGSRPGGFAPWEVRRAAWQCGLHPQVRVLDLVEVDPELDTNECTSLAAAACLLAFASGVVQRLGL